MVERGEDEPQTLTEKEWKKFVKFAFMHVNLWENAFINHQKGTITPDVFQAWDMGARYTFDHVGYQKFWGENRAAFHVDFVKHVEPFFAGIKDSTAQ